MSHNATVAAWRYRDETSSATDRFVLIALADEADSQGYIDGRARRSAEHLADKTGLCRRTIDRSLKALIDVNAVEIIAAPTHGGAGRGAPGDYRLTMMSLAGADWTQSPHGNGSRLDTESTRDGHTVQSGADHTSSCKNPGTYPGTSVEDGLDDARRLADLLADSIEERGSRRPSVTNAWVTEMDRLIRLDKRSPQEIDRTIRWLARGADKTSAFWQVNIRSPQKLRMQWDRMREQHTAEKNHSQSNGRGGNYFLEHYEELVS